MPPCCIAPAALREASLDALISEIVERSDKAIRSRLSEYMHTLVEVGVDAELLITCANEFIKEQTDPDRRFSGC